MEAFYPSSINQRDDMTNLYLSDSGQTLYPESSVGGNMMYLNFASSGPFSELLVNNNESQSNCNELSVISQESSMSGHAYNEMLFMQPNNGSMDGDNKLVPNSVILNGQALSLHQSKFSNVQGQGLSLSLGTQIPISSFRYPPSNSDICMNGEPCRDDSSRNNILHANTSPCGLANLASNISNSKYLKAAQNLLDEVVNVQKALKQKGSKSQGFNTSTGCKDDGVSKSDGVPSNPQESTANSSTELSPSERQDLQNKVTKLLAMLDEVDRRYKQYYHQMQIIVSSFDAIAGPGTAKPYTALALQTISRHFRCLRDAIGGQIQSTRKILGEQESSSTKGCGISRLRYVDHHLRQQRAIQQLGMMQPHTWRPQRGLPETSVSVLRAWLFEHFLHPYPKDSEKLMLARQTGLTRGQVSNWFINARVRLWKPMVEEMYKEEFGETEMDSNSSSENKTPKGREETRSSEDREDQLQSPSQGQFADSSKSNHIPEKFVGSTFHSEAIANDEAYGVLQAYSTLGLTLGLQHGDNALDGQHRFLEVRDDIYSTQASSSLGFGPSHLLHDFVA